MTRVWQGAPTLTSSDRWRCLGLLGRIRHHVTSDRALAAAAAARELADHLERAAGLAEQRTSVRT